MKWKVRYKHVAHYSRTVWIPVRQLEIVLHVYVHMFMCIYVYLGCQLHDLLSLIRLPRSETLDWWSFNILCITNAFDLTLECFPFTAYSSFFISAFFILPLKLLVLSNTCFDSFSCSVIFKWFHSPFLEHRDSLHIHESFQVSIVG